MGTTAIEAIRTIGEIQGYLVRMGASQIAMDFKNGEVSGLYFTMTVKGQTIPYQLPARIDPVYKILHQGRYLTEAAKDMQQAKRVAWRQIYRWIQAQLAMVEVGMVEAAEVMMPYIQVAPNETLYQRALNGGFQKLLGNGIPQREESPAAGPAVTPGDREYLGR